MANEKKRRKKNRAELFKALKDFSRADTPEEQAELDAFFNFMDTEEDKKILRCKINNFIFRQIEDATDENDRKKQLALIESLKNILTAEEYEKLSKIVGI